MELTDDWIGECFAEFQKRETGYKFFEQYFTPNATARRIAEITDEYGKDVYVTPVPTEICNERIEILQKRLNT